jgi:sporulation protein YlmC with PRC-barrel domain
MRQALKTVAALLLLASAQGAFAQTTAPAQPEAGPGTSASPSAPPPAVSPDSTAPIAPAPPAPAQPAPQPTVSAPPPPPMKQMSVSDLVEKDLEGAKENEIGDIERVVEATSDKKRFVVISRGGFLGLFESEVLVPLDNVAARGDRVVLRNMTEEQIKTLPKFDMDDKSYRELDGKTSIELAELK